MSRFHDRCEIGRPYQWLSLLQKSGEGGLVRKHSLMLQVSQDNGTS
jgi:hypothetical protein